MSNLGGRKRYLAWQDVSDIDGQKTQVECNHCGEKISKKIERIKTHLNKCRKKPRTSKAAVPSTVNATLGDVALVDDDSSSDDDSALET